MNTHALLFSAGTVLMVLCTLCSGCSLIGLAVDDSQQPDTLAVDTAEKSLEGKIIGITLKDGYSVAGECRRVGRLSGDLYRSRYAHWRGGPGGREFTLSPDDTVTISWEGEQQTKGVLEGFTRFSVIILPLPTPSALFPRPPQLLEIPAAAIDSVRKPDGTSLTGPMLRARLGTGNIPGREALLIRRGGTDTWVPLDEIVQIQEIRYSYRWFNRGAIADLAVLAAAVIAFAVRGN